jgi:hypothetical protein
MDSPDLLAARGLPVAFRDYLAWSPGASAPRRVAVGVPGRRERVAPAPSEAGSHATPGVEQVGDLRLRWIGHSLRAEVEVVVDPALPLVDAHRIAHDAEHRLLHDVPRLSAALVHANPGAGADAEAHGLVAHHR